MFLAQASIPPDASWVALKAAGWVSVHSWLSSSYFNLLRDLAVFIIWLGFMLWNAKRPGLSWSAMLNDWFGTLWNGKIKAGGYAVIVIAVFTISMLAYNYVQAYRIFVSDPPHVDFSWKKNSDGFEVNKGEPFNTTQEFERDNRQYVLDITYSRKYSVPASLDMICEFPFSLSMWSMNGELSDRQSTFSPMFASIPLKVNGPNIHLMGHLYRSWQLHVPEMAPGAHIRLVATMNIAYGADSYSYTPHGPLDDYLHSYTKFSFGNQLATTQSYAPFEIDKDKIVSLGPTKQIPGNLRIERALY